jgi:hypothetical protein
MIRSAIGRPIPLTLIGHPFATVGMGEQLRSYVAACRSVHLEFEVVDIFRYAARSDPDHQALIGPFEVKVPRPGIRIFHVNGDEIERVIQAFDAIGGRFSEGYNIIVPAWELPLYPAAWAREVQRFDEIWALSRFIKKSLGAAGISSKLIGQPVEVPVGPFLPRRHFGIRESAFTLLHFFDLTSFATRKNPDAVLTMFEALRHKREFADIQLVLKVKKGDEGAEDWIEDIRARLPEACLLAKPMNALETRSLINCGDCFVSLHRSEGFGRGTGEAMFLGRLALATGWSGNLDYMTKDNSFLVDYRLKPVRRGDYPFCDGQVWAEPNLDHAMHLLDSALTNPKQAAAIAATGRRDVRLSNSYRAVGLRILDRLGELIPVLAKPNASTVVRHLKRVPEEHSKMRSKTKSNRAPPRKCRRPSTSLSNERTTRGQLRAAKTNP